MFCLSGTDIFVCASISAGFEQLRTDKNVCATYTSHTYFLTILKNRIKTCLRLIFVSKICVTCRNDSQSTQKFLLGNKVNRNTDSRNEQQPFDGENCAENAKNDAQNKPRNHKCTND